MSVMTTVNYSPKDYNGTSTYVETVADYDSRVPEGLQMSDPFKLSMLQNAVSGVSELNQVKTLYSMNRTVAGHAGPPPLTFDVYLPMLFSPYTQ